MPYSPRIEQQPFEQSWEEFCELISGLGMYVPPAFWEILKVARVIFTPGNEVSDALRPSLGALIAADDSRDRDLVTVKVPVITAHSPVPEYRRIKGVDEVHLVNDTDMAILDLDELLIKAQDRELMVRVLDPAKQFEERLDIRPVQTSRDAQRLNPAAQKVYLLLDSSYSMRETSRMMFAKALLLEYLRVKRKGDSQMFFRAFDIRPYEVLTTHTRADYDRVMQAVLFSEPRAKGTDIQAAILAAAADIKRDELFREAEIVLVTDGVDRFDVAAIKAALGDKIKLNTFKIGFDSQEPGLAEIRDMKKEDQTLETLDRDGIAQRFQKILRSDFQAISTIFIELPDLDPAFYKLDQQTLEFVNSHVQRMTGARWADMPPERRFELYRRAAFMHDFIRFVLEDLEKQEGMEQRAADLRRQLSELEGLMRALLTDREVLLRVARSGNPNLINASEFRMRAEQEGLRYEVFDPLQSDNQLRVALGIKRKGRRRRAKMPHLFELLRMLLRWMIARLSRRAQQQA